MDEKQNIKIYKAPSLVVVVTMMLGLMFLAVGGMGFMLSLPDPNWRQVNGTVVDISVSQGSNSLLYAPVVSYSVGGVNYRINSSTSTVLKPALNSTQTVIYNPINPSEARVKTANFIFLAIAIFPLIGLISFVFSIILIFKKITNTRGKCIMKLRQNGNKLTGYIKSIDVAMTVNEVSIFKVQALVANALNGQTDTYTSDLITGAEALALVDFFKNKTPIDIYIDPVNPKKYYVDIDSLNSINPALAVQATELIQ
jgi:nitrate reductase NapE component